MSGSWASVDGLDEIVDSDDLGSHTGASVVGTTLFTLSRVRESGRRLKRDTGNTENYRSFCLTHGPGLSSGRPLGVGLSVVGT